MCARGMIFHLGYETGRPDADGECSGIGAARFIIRDSYRDLGLLGVGLKGEIGYNFIVLF